MELFSTGREMTRPRDSGLSFGDLSYAQLQAMSMALTDAERAAPSAAHYHEPMAPLPPEYDAVLQGPALPPARCHMPLALGPLLLADNAGLAENGYGILPNGVGYAAITIKQDGITDEMIQAYRDAFAADGPDTLFYKLWYPGKHLIHYKDGVAEDFGWGLLNLEMRRDEFQMRHLGLTMEEIPLRDPSCICLLGLCGRGWEVAHPDKPPIHTCMVQYTQAVPNGRELRVFYWSGITFAADGTLAFSVNPDRGETLAQMHCMMEHCIREYYNELHLIKAFWQAGK